MAQGVFFAIISRTNLFISSLLISLDAYDKHNYLVDLLFLHLNIRIFNLKI